MLLRSAALPLVLLAPAVTAAQPVWINEFHYDNASTDAGEFVEVAGPAGTDVAGFTVVLYNGSGGTVYDTFTLSGTIPDQQDGFGAVSIATPGIQNGDPDGIALCDAGGAYLQFLSYDGAFTASGGCAAGVVSTDVGVGETGSTPLGQSLQLTGAGTQYSDFAWSGPADDSPGAVNAGQTFGAGGDTVVQFASASGTAGEGDGTFDLVVTITNPSPAQATSVDVVFLPSSSTGSSADIGGFTAQTVTFPASSSADQAVTLTLTDDGDPEPDETFVFELQNPSGGQNASIGAPGQFTLALADDDQPVSDFVFINELDADTPSTDDHEFVELYDGGVGGTALDGLVLVLFNGTDNAAYAAYDLDGAATDAGGFFLVGNAAVGPDVTFASSTLQNGPDAAALYAGDAADFPSGTTPATTSAPLVDAVVYGTADDRDDDLLQAFGTDAGGVADVVTVQFDESYDGPADTRSLQRLNTAVAPTGGGTSSTSGLLYALAPTPRALNPDVVTVDETDAVADVAGWRMLSSPLYTDYGGGTPGPTVADYAAINLVQGIPGEYPTAGPNSDTP